jgi:hypothetical protein
MRWLKSGDKDRTQVLEKSNPENQPDMRIKKNYKKEMYCI